MHRHLRAVLRQLAVPVFHDLYDLEGRGAVHAPVLQPPRLQRRHDVFGTGRNGCQGLYAAWLNARFVSPLS